MFRRDFALSPLDDRETLAVIGAAVVLVVIAIAVLWGVLLWRRAVRARREDAAFAERFRRDVETPARRGAAR